MYFAATTNIYLMAFISIERFYVIYRPMNLRDINMKTSTAIILFCLLNGFVWAFLPLVGWSYYSPEGSLTSCSVEWKERTISVISYNIVMFVLVYCVPLAVTFGTNFKLLLLVSFFVFIHSIIHSFHKQFNLELNIYIYICIIR